MRSTYMFGMKAHLPPLTNKKIEEALIKLEVPENILATKENMKRMEMIKKLLLMIFTLHNHYNMKNEQLENLKSDDINKTSQDNNLKKGKEN